MVEPNWGAFDPCSSTQHTLRLDALIHEAAENFTRRDRYPGSLLGSLRCLRTFPPWGWGLRVCPKAGGQRSVLHGFDDRVRLQGYSHFRRYTDGFGISEIG